MPSRSSVTKLGTRVGDSFSTEASERENSLAAALKPLSPTGMQSWRVPWAWRCHRSHTAPKQLRLARPAAVWRAPGARGSPGTGKRVPRTLGRQEIPSRRSRQHRLRLRAQTPAANRLLPPLRSDGRDCAAGERGGGNSVPPRNARKTLPQLKFNRAIRSNTTAYSLNTHKGISATLVLPPLFPHPCLPLSPLRRPTAKPCSAGADGGTDRPGSEAGQRRGRGGAPAAPPAHGR